MTAAEDRRGAEDLKSAEEMRGIKDLKDAEEVRGAEEVSAAQEASMEKAKKKETRKKKKRLIGSFPAKVAAFFLLAVSSFVAAGSAICGVIAVEEGIYDGSTPDEVFLELGRRQIQIAAYHMKEAFRIGTEEVMIREYFESTNCDVDILYPALADRDGFKGLIWGTYDGSYETDMQIDLCLSYTEDDYAEDETQEDTVWIGGTPVSAEEPLLYRIYVNPEFPQNDKLRPLYKAVCFLYRYREGFFPAAIVSCFAALLCFIFLMRSAGHSNDEKERTAEAFRGIPLDIFAAVFLTGLVFLAYLFLAAADIDMLYQWYMMLGVLLLSAGAAAGAVWATGFFYETARQIKQGKWWRHTLIYVLLRGCVKAFRCLLHAAVSLLRKIPTVLTTVFLYMGLCVGEFVGILIFTRSESAGVMLWALEKLVLLAAVLYAALTCKRLLNASRALAQGQQDYVVDTGIMFGDFKEHAENLNSIGQGISKAVAERMKSEHLKTELITNVSHDIKTPLTSIINYSGLICEEKTENEKIAEYAEVLLRQSGRLKKLLDDLMEASKANTGNLEVNPVPCEVGVILSQAVGEYQQKLEEKGLELITAQPQEPVRILADGRHLWRVFDNMLSNICKYAQENSRVYLNVELGEAEVLIIFRNMSKYPLNIPTEELGERFVRGDSSRHMEGNGLGLSIAGSLTELQNGRMEIVTDGDLFKVTLRFPTLKE